MAEQLDVYRDWLGVKDTERPLNHYQLLRVAKFEDDAEKIRTNYRKLNAHVRKYASGQYAAQSQQVLNELAKAMLCLTDVQRKREYDATLGREVGEEGRRRTFEEILLANKLLDPDQLKKARNYATAVNVEIRDAVLQQKLAPPEAVMLAYAEALGLPYVELEDIGIDEQIVPHIPPSTARQHSCVPVMADEGQLLMASPNPLVPDVEEDLRLRLGMPVRTVLCTPASINAAITRHYPRDMPEPAPISAKSAPAKQKEKKAAASAEPLTPEEVQKRAINFSVIAFNICVVVVMLLRWLFAGGKALGYGTLFSTFIIGAVIGVLVAAATFVAVKKRAI
jgi:hypothetical protein